MKRAPQTQEAKPGSASLWRSDSALWPALLLIAALSSVFWFGHDRGYFYRSTTPHPAATTDYQPGRSIHDRASAKNLALAAALSWRHDRASAKNLAAAANLSWRSGFGVFYSQRANRRGGATRDYYGSFPVGGYALIKLAMAPFADDLAAMTLAARMLMLLLFSAAALLAYDAIAKVLRDRWIAATAVALAFSSYYCLHHNDAVDIEGSSDMFAVMLAFHGMAAYALHGRLRQLLVKTAVAAFLGWHVFAFLLPFVAVGLCRDFARAKASGSLKDASAAVVRSPFAVVGCCALAVGAAALGWNVLHQATGRGVPIPRTQVWSSMLGRTGLVDDYTADFQWWPFLWEQFGRVGEMMVLPYVLSAPLSAAAFTAQEATAIRFNFFGVLGMVAAACVLAGLTAVFVAGRRRGSRRPFLVVWLLGVLAVSGFCWALPMRGTTRFHDHECLFYIGLTLVLFSLAALAARRLCGGRVVVCVAVLAAGTFAWSARQMGFVGHDAESAQRQRALVRDFEAIRRITRGKDNVCVSPRLAAQIFSRGTKPPRHAVAYYLSGSNIVNMRAADAVRCPGGDHAGYVLSSNRQEEGAVLLTPGNEIAFLHARSSNWKSALFAEYRALVSATPLFRSEFDGHLKDGRLHYVKAPCAAEDVEEVFWVTVVPPLPLVTRVLPAHRQRFGSHHFNGRFTVEGVKFDGKCVVSIPLPAWTEVVATGQIGKSWRGIGRL